MTDTDFDELDEAVNSVLSSEKSNTNTKPISKPPLDTEPNITPSASELNKQVRTLAPHQLARVPTRRIMDIVHPSTTRALAKPTQNIISKSVSHEADPVTPQKKVTDSEPGAPSTTTIIVPEPDPAKLNQQVMPDPIDVSENLEKNGLDVDTTNSAPSSPFLPDAKVDKRPLGAYSNSPAVAIEAPSRNQTNGDDDKPFDTPMPAELDPKLLSIESGGDEEISKDSPAETNPSTQLAESKPADTEPPTSGSIYDTKEYHSPIKYPATKNVGWMKIIWSILIIVFCAGVAIVVYLLTLNQ